MTGKPVQILMTVCLTIFVACFGKSSTYFITPTPDTPCPESEVPCHTLSEYIADGFFNNLSRNSTIQFLPGNHTLETTIALEDLTFLAILGDSSSLPEVTSRIICTWPAGFAFTDITELHINALAFISCGHNYVGALNITSVEQSYISVCNFKSNHAAGNWSYGGAIAAWYSSLSLVGSMFQNNSAYNAGAINSVNGTLVLTTSALHNNYVERYGGAIATFGSTLSITTSTFHGNTAYQGGAIDIQDSSLDLTGTTFQSNSANINAGGAIAALGVMLNITTTAFLGNSASYQGGAIIIMYGTLDLTTTSFHSNCADSFGGAILTLSVALNIATSTFKGNSANQGGAISATGSSLVLTTSTFQNNSAAGSAGGAIATFGGTLSISITTFLSNSAVQGGAIDVEYGILSLTNNSFQNNSGSGGGAISTRAGSHNITANTFQSNSAYEGGAIDSGSGILSLTTNTFQSNSAHQGGAIYTNNGALNLTANMFKNNSADRVGGGITVEGSTLALTNNTFLDNSCAYGGVILALDGTLSLTSNIFYNNSAYIGGALHAISSTFILTGNVFHKNIALSSGGALAAYRSTINLTTTPNKNKACSGAEGACVLDYQKTCLRNASINSNTATYGGGLYVVNTTVHGNVMLTGNSAIEGGAIFAYIGTFLFNGTTTIVNNSATVGGGLLLSGDSKLSLPSGTTIHFTNNTANETGGAIHVKAVNQLELCVKELQDVAIYKYVSDCFFQIQPSNKQPYAPNNTSELRKFVQSLNITLDFENNSATYAGVDLYGGLVDSCSLSSIYENQEYYTSSYSGVVFDVLTSSESEPNITSDPLRFCICKDDCNVNHYSQSVYPGGTVEVPVTALGQRNQPTIATIHVVDISKSITLQSSEYSQNISVGCSTLKYTISSHAIGTTQAMTLYANGPCSFDNPVTVTIDILQCPPGFQLPHSGSHCTCDQRLLQYTDTCVVGNGTVLRPHDAEFWVGYNDGKGLILHPHCPFDYCTSEETYLKVTNSDKQCNNNRGGLLCGMCSNNLSVILGSSRCLKCSNVYISLLAAFALAGIALVLFLLLLRLTVAVGTINGLIFYANVVKMNSAILFRPESTNVLTVFIAWLNLDLGIETCFYNGMDAYSKTWLQFAFPVYVWTLVGVIIIGSNYSERMAGMLGRNPVAVLATLILLSYTKLLRTAIAALSYTTLEYPNSQIAVWLYDGNIGYLSSKHIPLFVMAVACLLLFFLPYTTLLTVAQWLQVKSEWRIFSWINHRYLKPFLDAYHARYSDKHRYCFGAMLILRLVLFLVSAVNVLGDPRINLLAVSVALTLTISILAGTGVYKTWFLSVLELSFLVNLTILVSITLYIYPNKANQNAVTFTSVSIAFATFIGIVIYHSIQQIKATQLWRKLFPKPEYERAHLDDEDGTEEDPPDRVYASGCTPTRTVVGFPDLQQERMHRAVKHRETHDPTELSDPWQAEELHEPQNPIESQDPLKATY